MQCNTVLEVFSNHQLKFRGGGEGASMVNYGRAFESFETMPTGIIAVQPVSAKVPKMLIHAWFHLPPS